MDGELRIEKSVRGFSKRIYEGSKLFFVLIIAVFAGLAALLVFVPEAPSLVLITLSSGILIGGSLGLLYHFRTASNATNDSVIPLDAIESVDSIDNRMFPTLVVNYRTNGSDKRYRIQFPYRWFSYTDEEFENAKTVFERNGIRVNEAS